MAEEALQEQVQEQNVEPQVQQDQTFTEEDVADMWTQELSQGTGGEADRASSSSEEPETAEGANEDSGVQETKTVASTDPNDPFFGVEVETPSVQGEGGSIPPFDWSQKATLDNGQEVSLSDLRDHYVNDANLVSQLNSHNEFLSALDQLYTEQLPELPDEDLLLQGDPEALRVQAYRNAVQERNEGLSQAVQQRIHENNLAMQEANQRQLAQMYNTAQSELAQFDKRFEDKAYRQGMDRAIYKYALDNGFDEQEIMLTNMDSRTYKLFIKARQFDALMASKDKVQSSLAGKDNSSTAPVQTGQAGTLENRLRNVSPDDLDYEDVLAQGFAKGL